MGVHGIVIITDDGRGDRPVAPTGNRQTIVPEDDVDEETMNGIGYGLIIVGLIAVAGLAAYRFSH